MNPDTISLTTPSRSFSYEKLSREIESCDNIIEIKNMLRCYVKLYLKQQETLSSIGVPSSID
jgi:hypothetical protein